MKTPPKPSPPEIAGDSPAVAALRAKIAAAAGADTVVIFSGPVGSGRTLAARCLHGMSARADGPFVVVPCGALSPTLAESELFGHEKGAFTGAVARHSGLVERASGGVVMLAEVAELPTAVQPKLLRFLDDYGAKALRAAVIEALERETPRISSVAYLLERHRRAEGTRAPLPVDLSRRPDLADLVVRPHQAEIYDELSRSNDDDDKDS